MGFYRNCARFVNPGQAGDARDRNAAHRLYRVGGREGRNCCVAVGAGNRPDLGSLHPPTRDFRLADLLRGHGGGQRAPPADSCPYHLDYHWHSHRQKMRQAPLNISGSNLSGGYSVTGSMLTTAE